MSTMIQIRNVPDNIHRELKIRAVEQGISLSELLLREITRVATRPRLEDTLARLRRRSAGSRSETAVEALRAERDAR